MGVGEKKPSSKKARFNTDIKKCITCRKWRLEDEDHQTRTKTPPRKASITTMMRPHQDITINLEK